LGDAAREFIRADDQGVWGGPSAPPGGYKTAAKEFLLNPTEHKQVETAQPDEQPRKRCRAIKKRRSQNSEVSG
jgi:hypothetical protein